MAENDIKTNGTQSDVNLLKNTFERIANSYKGITGNTTLNSVGDRKYGEYDFWAIRDCNNNGGDNHETLTWKRVSKHIYNHNCHRFKQFQQDEDNLTDNLSFKD